MMPRLLRRCLLWCCGSGRRCNAHVKRRYLLRQPAYVRRLLQQLIVLRVEMLGQLDDLMEQCASILGRLLRYKLLMLTQDILTYAEYR